MLAGTAVDGKLQVMNCSKAICADASCMATRSGLSLRFALPLMSFPLSVLVSNDSSGLSKCEYRIFSASVNWCESPNIRRTWLSFVVSFWYGGVRDARSTLGERAEWVVARYLLEEGWRY